MRSARGVLLSISLCYAERFGGFQNFTHWCFVLITYNENPSNMTMTSVFLGYLHIHIFYLISVNSLPW